MALHPLFDPRSRYRQATQATIWSDGGRASVRRFFQDRARQELQEAWLTGIPEAAQDFGYSHDFNQALYETMISRANAANAAGAPAVLHAPERPKAAPPLTSPALLVLDFKDPAAVPDPQQFIFPALGEETCTGFSPRGPRESNLFEIDLWLHEYRHTVLLLLSPTRLKHLAEVLGVPVPAVKEDVVSLIQKTLAQDSLSKTAREPGQPSLASQVFDILRLVPTLEGISNARGRLQMRVDLGDNCPTMDRDGWLVACQGPSVTE